LLRERLGHDDDPSTAKTEVITDQESTEPGAVPSAVCPSQAVFDPELREQTVTGAGVVDQYPNHEGDALRFG
ncbi:hypothetical protein, partial [Nocardia gipuzkoensis]|uniref:hypothetical protein n=1 Tax=Nocardia gipuzkoensis TaxID=2749991 RepID=UPI00237D789A